MKKSVSSCIVDNGARLSKIYDLAEEYATEILILRQKLYEAQLDKIIVPLSKICKKQDTIESLQYLRERLIDERGSDFSGVRALDIAIYCVNNMEGRS